MGASSPRSTKGLITQAEACSRLGVKERALQQYVARGELECIRIPYSGKRTRPWFDPKEITRFLEAQRRAS